MKIQAARITPDNFSRYGQVVQAPQRAPTAAAAAFKFWSDLAHYGVDGETEIGLCTVYRQEEGRVPWMERHLRTPEVLVPVDAPFVLPVMPDEGAEDGVEAFRVEPGEAVVIGQGVWHSACHPVGRDEATYFVIFRRGTPQEDVIKKELEDVVVGV